MNQQQAQLIDFIDFVDPQPGEGHGEAEISSVPQARVYFREAIVKPVPEPKPTLADVVPAVAAERPKRHFIEPAVWNPPIPQKEAFLALQRWEGVVTECGDETFLARLNDLSAEGADEEVELPLQDISDEDRPLVALGAVFYWAIGYRFDGSGQRSRVSSLRFRRLPVWSAAELAAARERAAVVAGVFAAD
jgi:hypothetical protein